MSDLLQRLREARARALAASQSDQVPAATSFTLEDSIPLPPKESDEERAPEQEDTRWQPFQWKSTPRFRIKCGNLDHRPMVGRCEKCGDIFPCPSGNCGHVDCAEAGSGTSVPEFVHVQ